MPNNSCTVILNGHGIYSNKYIIDIRNSQYNYNVVFPCQLNATISDAHNNLLLNSFTNNIGYTFNVLENIPSTYILNKQAPQPQQHLLSIDMFANHNLFTYEHGLSNALNVPNALSLINIDNQRFSEQEILIEGNHRNWNGSFFIQYDRAQVINDVINAHQIQGYIYNITIDLSLNNLIYLKPVAQGGQAIQFRLSDLLDDIIPKIKIPVIYHNNNTADVIQGGVHLDDTGFFANQMQQQQRLMNNTDMYHEVVISGDANIIWDACRDYVVEN